MINLTGFFLECNENNKSIPNMNNLSICNVSLCMCCLKCMMYDCWHAKQEIGDYIVFLVPNKYHDKSIRDSTIIMAYFQSCYQK